MQKTPNIKPGDVVFFKSVTRECKKTSTPVAFKGGTGFGVILGIVPPFGRPPTEAHLMMLMGSAGFVSFDDVVKFLGEDLGKKCIADFEEKYYPKKDIEPEAKEIERRESRLILPEHHEVET